MSRPPEIHALEIIPMSTLVITYSHAALEDYVTVFILCLAVLFFFSMLDIVSFFSVTDPLSLLISSIDISKYPGKQCEQQNGYLSIIFFIRWTHTTYNFFIFLCVLKNTEYHNPQNSVIWPNNAIKNGQKITSNTHQRYSDGKWAHEKDAQHHESLRKYK